MRFSAQIKEIKRISLISNDTQYSVKLITEQNLAELMGIEADQLVDVYIEIKQD